MTTQQLLTLFLASPGDVAPERDMVCRIVEEYNGTVGEAHGVRVQVVRWETDARPGWGKDGQAMINKLIEGRDHDLFVVLFWNRFGTPTPRAPSGTLEEFRLAVKARLKRKRPEIMLYFNTAPATLNSDKELEQRKAVLDFKASVKDGLYGTYKGKAAFEKTFRRDYGRWLQEEIAALQKPRRASKPKPDKPLTPPPKPRASKKPAPKLQPILLSGDLFWAEKVIERGANWTVILRPQDDATDRKIRALSAHNQWHQQLPLAFEYQAGHAQPTKPNERSSDAKGVFWTLELRFTPLQTNAMHRVNFNGLSAAEIAQKKAEWLLLAQQPALPAPQYAGDTSNRWAEQHITGSGPENQPIFPALWKGWKGDATQFRAAAQLQAVFRLLSNGICDEITELKLGTIRAARMTVHFRGKQTSFHGHASGEIIVKGQCALGESKSPTSQ